jgi:DNA-binding transcriptional ArsR family regulator
VQIVRDRGQTSALCHPERARLLAALAEPDSAAGLARRFDLPRQRLNYHLRELEKAGLVELVEERRKGNCTERVVRATARAYVISPEVLGELAGGSPARAADRFSASHLVGVAARVISDIAALGDRAASQRKRLATLTIDTEVRFASADARAKFADELSAALAALSAKYHDESAPEGRWHRLVAAVYPKIEERHDGGRQAESR